MAPMSIVKTQQLQLEYYRRVAPRDPFFAALMKAYEQGVICPDLDIEEDEGWDD